MTAKECIEGRRSIRKFLEKPVERSVLQDIVATASYAPSWKNTQIVRYIVVDDPVLKNKIATDCTTLYPANADRILSAPAIVVVTALKNRCGFERDGSYSTHRGDGWQMFDTGIASEAFCLSAYEHGLGTVILGLFDDDKVMNLLSIPEDREVITMIPIGYPAEAPVAPKRKAVDELLSFI